MLIEKASCDEPFTLNGSWAWLAQNSAGCGSGEGRQRTKKGYRGVVNRYFKYEQNTRW